MIKAEITMRSTVLDMDTKIEMLLPEDRHKTQDTRGKKYPVLYVLHGKKDDCSSWINLSNIMLLCRDLELIVVFPSVTNSMYSDMVYGYDYFSYITEELPVKLKNYFPITDDVDKTFIIGESMGGYGTLKAILSKPDRYAKGVCLSGANVLDIANFDDKLTIANFGSREEAYKGNNNIEKLVDDLKDYKGKLPELAIYCGTEDFIYEACRKTANYMKENLPDMKITEEYWHGQHNFFFWNEALVKAFRFFGFNIEQNSVI